MKVSIIYLLLSTFVSALFYSSVYYYWNLLRFNGWNNIQAGVILIYTVLDTFGAVSGNNLKFLFYLKGKQHQLSILVQDNNSMYCVMS